ncbi:hypothetical protein [Bradyrhizobium elkanii]|uniref:hypothetical protein n=1 Tax=Bradyrhizobium elkanii TaxID=29448 RepID=UPI0008420344|nr:hypothetical protein [Bradyrhizobium elkanii]ODM73108.1 hypothetical protein A6X20_38775 [Bradyrhizobium elkanii]ODM76869.1 hypothetical protein A6452_01545 [Bradyrhizobium elkanii]
MVKPHLENIDPLQIYMHALGFHAAEDALGHLTLGPNTQLAGQVAQPCMAVSALTSELFFKCLVCIETSRTPKGHHLFELFGLLAPETRSKIVHLWDAHVVPHRKAMWDTIDQHHQEAKISRDLPGALLASSRAFETIRYNYEPDNQASEFNIGDLPRVLRRVVLQMKPEWANLGRGIKPVPGFRHGQK